MKKAKPTSEAGTVHVCGEMVRFIIERSRRRKRTIAFRMESDFSLRLLVPVSANLRTVTRIIQSHAPWLARKLEQQKRIPPSCSFVDGDFFPYMGHKCRLHVTQGNSKPQSCILYPKRLCIHVPDEALSPDSVCEEVKLEIALWAKKRARSLFKKRLDFWANQLGVKYTKLIIVDPEKRWGSCSANNIIRLNWRLIMAPLKVIDYVVLHELSHIRHKDHSRRFWGFLESHMPDWHARRKLLRELEQRPIL